MNRKQKKMLTRILCALALMIGFAFLPVEGWLRFVLYMIPYFIVGYDILKKAALGIYNKQIFDENFLMTLATIGAFGIEGLTLTGGISNGLTVKSNSLESENCPILFLVAA